PFAPWIQIFTDSGIPSESHSALAGIRSDLRILIASKPVVLERIISGNVAANRMETLFPWVWKAEREAMTDQGRHAA
ncbi:IS66 family transposase, partial [Rhizobium favelukesii]|nr:IS66 family transposase [Rhizobium favelukesii]